MKVINFAQIYLLSLGPELEIWVKESVNQFFKNITTKALWEIAKFVHSLTIIWFSKLVDNIAYRKLQRNKKTKPPPLAF